MTTETNNIKPNLVFRVGIIGHRPSRLKKDLNPLSRRIAEILSHIEQTVSHFGVEDKAKGIDSVYSHAPVQVRALTSLASGVDTIFAFEAQKMGLACFAILPKPYDAYCEDFSNQVDESGTSELITFKQLAIPMSRFELDRNPGFKDHEYRRCGQMLAQHSDLLIIVWDGDKSRVTENVNIGGTEDSMAFAQQNGIPMLLIDAKNEHGWRFINEGEVPYIAKELFDEPIIDKLSTLTKIVNATLEMPPSEAPEEGVNKAEYSRFTREKVNISEVGEISLSSGIWSIIDRCIGKNRLPNFRLKADHNPANFKWRLSPDAQKVVDEKKETENSKKLQAIVPILNEYIEPYKKAYIYADLASIKNGERYRASYVSLFFLSAMAVFCALFPILFKGEVSDEHYILLNKVFHITEAMILVTIIVWWVIARRSSWHKRWLNYRLLSEILRYSGPIAALGSTWAIPPSRGHQKDYLNPASSWITWYVKARQRSIGLPHMAIDTNYIEVCQNLLTDILNNQYQFHKGSISKNEKIEHRLHNTSMVLLIATLISCMMHIYFHTWSVLTVICGVFPAFGAAFAAINFQGEFRRNARTSKGMEKELKERIEQLNEVLSQTPVGMAAGESLQAFANETVTALVHEVVDWQVSFQNRPVLPGSG